jgi:hypothetical protein
MNSAWIVGLAVTLGLVLAGCGGNDIGEPCDTTGSQDECVDGAICDTEGDERLCLALCKEDTECSSDRKCTGVSESNLKACHPR